MIPTTRFDRHHVYRLRIEGERCLSCEALLATSLTCASDVEAVSMNAEDGRILAYADPACIRLDTIVQVAARCGFVAGEPSLIAGPGPEDEAFIDLPLVVDEVAWVEAEELRALWPGDSLSRSPSGGSASILLPRRLPECADAVCADSGCSGEQEVVWVRRFALFGVGCIGCERVVERLLGRIPGVLSVEADHVSGVLVLAYVPSRVSADNISDALDDLGFGLAPLE